MYVCKTALDDFQTILNTLGGENEKSRAAELLETCKMVPDQPSVRSQDLPKTGKIRDRSKVHCIADFRNMIFVYTLNFQITRKCAYERNI